MSQTTDFLDHLTERILDGDGKRVVAELGDHFRQLRAMHEDRHWMNAVVSVCRRHPIQELLLEDPYTARAFRKPRGYAGDAVMLDYIYSGEPPLETSAIGRAIFDGTTGLPNGQSVILRRNLLAKKIDETTSTRPDARVLSIACGHLREAECSRAVTDKRVLELVAFDQDAESLSVVSRDYSPFGVTTVHGTVMDIIRRRVRFVGFDLVYAAGLFDYLSDKLARRLLALMVAMVRPGGRVVVANFTPGNHGRGYMECFMDWTLMCRGATEMQDLIHGLYPCMVTEPNVYHDVYGNIAYLEVEIL